MKIVKTFIDVAKIVLWAESPVEEGKRARFQIGLRDGNPRFVVYTGGKGKESILNFPMGVVECVSIMNMLKDVASGENGKMIDAVARGNVWKDDKPTNETKDIATLHLGKSKEGIVFLSVTMEGRPKIVFPLKASNYTVFRDQNKQAISESYYSEKMAISVADLTMEICAMLIMNYTTEEYTNGTRTAVEISGNDSNGRPTGNRPGSKPPQGSKFEDLDELTL